MVSEWMRHKSLGKGKHSSVHLAHPSACSSSCKTSALSCNSSSMVVKSASLDHDVVSSLQREINILYELRGCPQIVQCFGDDLSVDRKGRPVYNLLLEYAPGGTLQQFLRLHGGKISEYEASCFAHMLLKGLSHVHEEGYVHCNLKPSNILVFPFADDKNDIVKYFLKIANFRLAKRAGEESKSEHCIHKNLGIHKNRGTLEYSSPESVAYGEHEAPMDVWSLGCIVGEILIGMPLWAAVNFVKEHTLSQIIANYEDGWLRSWVVENQAVDFLSQNAKDFLWRCLRRDAKKRWNADQLLQHPFITENSNVWMPLQAETEKIMEYPKTPFNSSFVSKFCLVC